MRRSGAMLVAVVVVLAAAGAGFAIARARRSDGAGGGAGASALSVTAYSCAAATACAIAGGSSVDEELRDVWAASTTLPGVAGAGALQVNDLACPTATTCTAVGSAPLGVGVTVAVVADEHAGSWHVARLGGLVALGVSSSSLDHLECPAPGECVAGGTFERGGSSAPARHEILVATEHRGVWSPATQVPGLASASTGGLATTDEAVACAAPGRCATVGEVTPRVGGAVAGFVSEEQAGTWSPPHLVAGGTRAPYVELQAVSCAAHGWCVAGGREGTNPNGLPFSGWGAALVVSERDGTWTAPFELEPPGGVASYVDTVDCPARGWCVAGGGYTASASVGVGSSAITQPIASIERAGRWSTPYGFSDAARYNYGAPNYSFAEGNGGEITILSCSARGTCLAGGVVTTGESRDQSTIYRRSFTTPLHAGRWGSSTFRDDLAGLQCFSTRQCAVLLQQRPDDVLTYTVVTRI